MQLRIVFCAALLAAAAGESSAQTTRPAGAPVVVLSLAGNWRAFYVLRGPLVRGGGGLQRRGGEVDTPLPPKDWTQPGFDDGAWHRLRGQPCQPNLYGKACARANAGFTYLDGSSAYQSLICVRGRFLVTDPAGAKDLSLMLAYRGGVVVHLNGREIARGHMPAGEIDADTLAEDYPAAVFLDPEGRAFRENWGEKDPEVIERWGAIRRKLAGVKVPAGLLRKGVNVLAVEVHRSAYPQAYEDKVRKLRGYRATPYVRSTCGITDLALRSPDGRGVRANTVRPAGLGVWNSSLFVADPYDFGDPLEPLRPVDIPACRNGRFSGEVSVGSTTAITKLRADVTDLVDARTKAVLPASAAVIRYGASVRPPDEVKVVRRSRYRTWKYAEAPPERGGAVQPITVTVGVPRDAKPGTYEGKLSVRAAAGGPFDVPVRVTVSPFTLPDPSDYETVVDIIQSPDTLALQYGAPLWSDEHWRLIDRSFEVLGTAGLDAVYIPMIAETHFGNAQAMVRWIRKAGGGHHHDLSVVEKYLDAYERHCGRPRIVCLYVWDITLEGGSTWVNRTMGIHTEAVLKAREAHARLKLGPLVTALDPATGKAEPLQLPQYSDQPSLELWRPLYAKLRAILKKRGLEGRVMLGIPLDPKPTKGVVELFRQLMPLAPWMVQDHIYRKAETIHGAAVAYQANVFLHGLWTHDVNRSRYGMKHPETRLLFARGLTARRTPASFRLLGEKLALTGLQGFARVGGDMWPVLPPTRRKRQITIRYPKASAGGLSVWTCMLAPGPEGAVATPHFELLREGLQEAEARMFVERALLEGKLTGDLARRCQRLLVQRNKATLIALLGKTNDSYRRQWWEQTMTYGFGGVRSGYLWHLASGHDARARELFDLAAEVAGKSREMH